MADIKETSSDVTKREFKEYHEATIKASEGGDMIAQRLAAEKLPFLNALALLIDPPKVETTKK